MATPPSKSPAPWFCVQTRPKQERLAAASLARVEGIEIYSPHLRIQRILDRGKVWFQEALFPCYIFARFDLELHSRNVSYANGVARILRFGDSPAEVPESMIEEIQKEMGGEIVKEVYVTPKQGDEGELASGPLKGFQGVINRVDSGRARAEMFVEFLGGVHTLNISLGKLKTPRHAREFVAVTPT